MKTYAIADLHGRFDLLCAALTKITDDAAGEKARLVIMGDMIDRGPNSRGIIDLLMYPSCVPKNIELTVLQGNHEKMLLASVMDQSGETLRWWSGHGGHETLLSYGDVPNIKAIPVDHLEWLYRLPLYLETEGHVFVHAGITDDSNLEDQSADNLQWMIYPDGHVGGWRDKYVVHGHNQHAHGPMIYPKRINLDTYAWKTGRLVIGVFGNSGPAIAQIEVMR